MRDTIAEHLNVAGWLIAHTMSFGDGEFIILKRAWPSGLTHSAEFLPHHDEDEFAYLEFGDDEICLFMAFDEDNTNWAIFQLAEPTLLDDIQTTLNKFRERDILCSIREAVSYRTFEARCDWLEPATWAVA